MIIIKNVNRKEKIIHLLIVVAHKRYDILCVCGMYEELDEKIYQLNVEKLKIF